MKIAIGCDDAGEPLLNVVGEFLRKHPDVELVDFSAPEDEAVEYYPDVAERVALAVRDQGFERGILVCGTGIGMAITACKVPGIRAALCHDTYSAERARKSNNAQILTMGARVIGPELAKSIVDVWLKSEFDEHSSSAPKVRRMVEDDEKYTTTKPRPGGDFSKPQNPVFDSFLVRQHPFSARFPRRIKSAASAALLRTKSRTGRVRAKVVRQLVAKGGKVG
jgi:ribose 5-phosphate isomerase B